MARVLLLCDRVPADLSSGRYLRIYHLCRELASHHQCFFMDLDGQTDAASMRDALGVLDACSARTVLAGRPSARRHFRIGNANYLKLSYPAYFRDTLGLVRERIDQWRIDLLLVFEERMAEMALELDTPKILNYADCDTLTLRRVAANRGTEMSLSERVQLWLQQVREGARERALVRGFDITTTIAEPDRRGLLASSGVVGERVVVVPNGVAQEALDVGNGPGQPDRSIVFWGNLDFPPNWTAVRFFFDSVFLPYLADADVTWHIYGRGGGEHLRDVMEHPRIHMEGFRERLFEEIAGRGVMINPMVEGSGLKNKVLEAFACRIPVVSTTLGVEALPVTPGRECLIADDAAGLARAVLELLDRPETRQPLITAARQLVEETFTWSIVGARLGAIVDNLAATRMSVTDAPPPAKEIV